VEELKYKQWGFSQILLGSYGPVCQVGLSQVFFFHIGPRANACLLQAGPDN